MIIGEIISINDVDDILTFGKKELCYSKLIINGNNRKKIYFCISLVIISIVFIVLSCCFTAYQKVFAIIAIILLLIGLPFAMSIRKKIKMREKLLYENRINLLNDYLSNKGFSIGQLKVINKVLKERKSNLLSSQNTNRILALICALFLPIWYKYIDYYFNKYIFSADSFQLNNNSKLYIVIFALFIICSILFVILQLVDKTIRDFYLPIDYLGNLLDDLIFYKEDMLNENTK